jgi:hypothetical protein
MAMNKAQLEAEATRQLMEQAKIRSEMSNSLEGYLNTLHKIKETNDTIAYNQKVWDELDKIKVFNSNKERKIHEAKKKILIDTNKQLNKTLEITKENLKTVNATNLVMAKMGSTTVKALSALPGFMANSYGKLKGYGLFEMEKAVKMSALQMGLLGKEGEAYSNSIRNTAADTNLIGVGIEALAKMQGQYTEDLGRSVMLGDKGLKAMAAMSVVTGLGAEGTGQLAANMEEIGVSAERTGDYINQTMNDSHKMGLNASKVVKNIAGNIKMLNKYHFKDGISGLAKMAELSAKLGVEMDFASGLSDKLWDIEGAVDMSAQLQVMGGAWAKMADPFHLMYMAREDMAGLTKELAEGAAAAMHFAQDGSIELSSQKMSELKKIAQDTNTDYDKLITSGKELFKMNKVKSQIAFGVPDDMKEFIANTAQLDKNGKASIEINGSSKLVSQMTAGDQKWLQGQVAEKKSMEKRAEAAQNFDDQITNLINQVKTYMLPIIDGINQTLGPVVKELMTNDNWKVELIQIGKDIGNFIKGLGPVVKTVSDFIVAVGPKGILYSILGGKLLLNAVTWFANGISLGLGFKSVTGGIGAAMGSLGKGIAKVGGYVGLAVSAIQIGADALKNARDPNLSAGEATWKTIKDNKWKLIGGAVGGAAGAAAGLLTGGAASVPGAMIGAGWGSQLGGMMDSPSNDGFFGAPMHDGMALGGMMGGPLGAMLGGYMGNKFGGDFNKGRGIIQGGKIHPIDNKDDLLAMKRGGVIDKANRGANIPATINHTFGPLVISGSITLDTPGNPGQGVDLLKNAHFIRQITNMIHAETSRIQKGK